MTSSVRTGSSRSERLDGQPLAARPCASSPSTVSGPTRRRISSKARGQSSSAPSSSPIRWSAHRVVPSPGRRPRCGCACCPCPCSRCPPRVRRPPPRWTARACRRRPAGRGPTMSMTRSGSISCGIRLADGADQRGVGCRPRERGRKSTTISCALAISSLIRRSTGGAEVGRHRGEREVEPALHRLHVAAGDRDRVVGPDHPAQHVQRGVGPHQPVPPVPVDLPCTSAPTSGQVTPSTCARSCRARGVRR